MKKERFDKENLTALILSMTAIAVMSAVERFLMPPYFLKSIIKVTVFTMAILIHGLLFKKSYSQVTGMRFKAPSRKLFLFMILVYLFIILAFLIARDQIDLDTIEERLLEKEGLNRNNFLFIFSYIILCNSYLEESFFRGYLSRHLSSDTGIARICSAILFALYHVSIMSGWFPPILFILLIAGLSISALILQYIADREETIAASWLVHAFANLAINTIGTIMILT
ncbi:MAG: CPBP family intramembrane metalloprotease [Erysipelotrichaceae bacterium]|nr:CPBP family intramembrane metalloprotease [Erysipelotrichaceae bacterium]